MDTRRCAVDNIDHDENGRKMISSQPISCHVLHCCCVIGILKWLDLSNTDSPPGNRVVACAGLVLISAVLTAGVSIAAKKWKADRADAIRNVRKKSRKSGTGLDESAGNRIADSVSALIELSAERKLTKRAGQLAVTLISFAVVLHATILLLGAPFIRLWERTAALSSVIAILTVVPLFHASPDNQAKDQPFHEQLAELVLLKRLPEERRSERRHLLWVLWGAWLACLATKLDWKQVWQEYPVPGVCGALAASLLSHVTYLTQVGLRRLLLSANY